LRQIGGDDHWWMRYAYPPYGGSPEAASAPYVSCIASLQLTRLVFTFPPAL